MEARSVGRMTGCGAAEMSTSLLPTFTFLFFREYFEHIAVSGEIKMKI